MRVSLFNKIMPDAIRIPLALFFRKLGISTKIQTALHQVEVRRLTRKHRNDPAFTSSAKVLIICAHYNHHQYLSGCIDSILASTHQSWQLVIVDDQSTTPLTLATIREQSARDPRIKAIQLTKNSGAYIARNTALSAADPDWTHITFVDPDDEATPTMLEHLLYVLRGREGTVRPVLERWSANFTKLKSIYHGHCQSLHSRLAWERAGGFLPILRCGDAELTIRMSHLAQDGKTAIYKGWHTAQRMRLLPGSSSHQDLTARKLWLESRDTELSTLPSSALCLSAPTTCDWKDCSE
jgi:glycosyltransferase involved in cell wall biosynthesis